MKKVLIFFLVALVIACTKQSGSYNRNASEKVSDVNAVSSKAEVTKARRGEVLFLGHNSKHHDSWKYAPWLGIKLFRSGINMTYTVDLNDLNTENLSKYDGLIIYANHETISPQQESAMKAFVESGKGLIPLHSAAGCFRNSEWYIKTIGGRFESHKTGNFKNSIVNKDHPIMKGIGDFETFDETYVHSQINPDIQILGERVEGTHREPYTWVRNEGKGRVFYTAYGHQDETWTNIGFLDLVRNGVLWALGDDVQKSIKALNISDTDIYNADTISHYTKRHVVPKMQNALTPAESNKITQVGVDFDIQLFASEPDITNPIAMAWDERGRLWIVESVDYPNTFKETDGAANDRIKICEDTDGDGKADKFTVFADKLNIPTSIVFSNGGVIVSMAPDFVFMKDTNGDDVADVREVIMTGWGKNDTHAGPSNLMYGFDNKIWGVNGYSGFNGTIDGKKFNFPQGVYNFKPNGKEFDFLGNSSNNTWGLGFTEDNNVFLSTANNTHSAFYSMPARYLQRNIAGTTQAIQAVQKVDGHYDAHPLTPNMRQVDVVGGFTSAAGHRFYTARNFPKEYWNKVAFVTEPTIRLVHNAILERDGAGFKERDGWNFMASSDEWFGPVHAEVGPDGAVWVADWYNFIIQHNVFVPAQSPSEFILPFVDQPHGQGNAFVSGMRDLNHGRVYRVVYKNAKKAPALKLSKSDLPGLIKALENDNMFWRMTAQRLLVEAKSQTVLPELYRIANNQSVDEIGLNSPAVHALWTLHGLGALDGSNQEALAVASKALSHPAAGVRKAAASVIPKTAAGFELMQKALKDSDLNARLSAFVALLDYPESDKIGEALYLATQDEANEKDPWLSKAILAASIVHEKGFAKAAENKSAGSFTTKVSEALSNESYPLGRRSNVLFSPDVAGKEILIKATVTKANDKPLQGFIAGQGNKKEGYALYIQDGKVKFAVNQHGTETVAASTGTLPEKFEVVAKLLKGGKMSLEIDGKVVSSKNAHMIFPNTLEGRLRTGEDFEGNDKLGNYAGRFGFDGNFQNASLELRKPSAKSVSNAGSTKKTAAASDATVIDLKVVLDVMQYDKKLITVKAGQKVIINFENPDGMQHNLLIVKPGSLQKVGKAADEMLRDPKAAEKQYIPTMPEILHATRLLDTGDSVTLEFTVPSQPGDYPYLCTFPGHWRGMNGILRVVK